MKKIILLFSLVILSYVASIAQRTYNEEISFSYVRNPLQLLPNEIKTYSIIANIAYAEEILAEKESWEKSKEEKIEERKEEKQAYKEKSLGSKLLGNVLLDEEKPKDAIIGEKYFSKIYDASEVTSRINLDGYDLKENTDLKLEVTILGFTYLIEEDIIEKEKDDVVTKSYRYKISYKHPMEVKLLDGFDDEIQSFEMPDLKTFATKNTKKFSSRYELEKYWKESSISYLRRLDEKATNTNLKYINEFLNSEFGYSKLTRTCKIGMVKPKKYEYDEFFNAYEQIFTGYNYLIENKEEADNSIKEAIGNWEAALKESDLDDKKARINSKVTVVIHLNCAEAYCWLNDFQNARHHIMKIKMMKTRGYESKVEAIQELIKDQEKRYKASLAIEE